MKREQLEPFTGKGRFVGEGAISQFGWVTLSGARVATFCLEDILLFDANGVGCYVDHAWVRLNKHLQNIPFRLGEVIRFSSKVKLYYRKASTKPQGYRLSQLKLVAILYPGQGHVIQV